MTGWRRCLVGLGLFALGLLCGYGVLAWQGMHRPSAATAEQPCRSWEATVYLPSTDNQGRRFAEADWEAAVGILVKRFGGATLADAREGYWVDSKQNVCKEPVRLVIVSFAKNRLDEFRESLREIGRRLGQESIYMRLEDAHIELIEVKAAKSGE